MLVRMTRVPDVAKQRVGPSRADYSAPPALAFVVCLRSLFELRENPASRDEKGRPISFGCGEVVWGRQVGEALFGSLKLCARCGYCLPVHLCPRSMIGYDPAVKQKSDMRASLRL